MRKKESTLGVGAVEVRTITRPHAVFLVLVTFSALAGAAWLLWLLE